MKIKYFAWLKTITETESEEILNNDIKDTDALKKYLCSKYPKLKKHILKDHVIQIAVNLEYTSENQVLKDKDEIALFPPVSGG